MFWMKNGYFIQQNGYFIDCSHCPCDESSSSSTVYCWKVTRAHYQRYSTWTESCSSWQQGYQLKPFDGGDTTYIWHSDSGTKQQMYLRTPSYINFPPDEAFTDSDYSSSDWIRYFANAVAFIYRNSVSPNGNCKQFDSTGLPQKIVTGVYPPYS